MNHASFLQVNFIEQTFCSQNLAVVQKKNPKNKQTFTGFHMMYKHVYNTQQQVTTITTTVLENTLLVKYSNK